MSKTFSPHPIPFHYFFANRVTPHNLAQARRLADTVAVCWASEGGGCAVESGPCGVLFERAAHPITRAYCGGEVG